MFEPFDESPDADTKVPAQVWTPPLPEWAKDVPKPEEESE